eukprot:sb/3465114/
MAPPYSTITEPRTVTIVKFRYIEAVFPGEYGIKQKPWFFVTRKGYDQGWVALQQVIDRSIMLSLNMTESDIPVMSIRQMPYPAWTEDGFANAIRNSLPLMLVISFLWIGASISKRYYIHSGQRYSSCLLSSTCMGYGANIISKWETMKEGLQFDNVGKQTSDLDLFTFGDVMLMIFVDIVVYSLLTWYIEAVFPGEYGIKQKPWFFVTRKYWFGSTPKKMQKQNGTVITNNYSVNSNGFADYEKDLELKDMEDEGNGGEHEKGPNDKNIGISIRNLVKKFKTPKGKITAVNGLSLDMYEDQITSLLGHNGAGKTTTMSMLTGLYSPSGGEATINGYSILDSMDRVRDSLGICPQHNVLFDRLTVKEHLDFFIKLKGYTGDVDAEIVKMIQMLQLVDKTDSKADELSGGMKRKLR